MNGADRSFDDLRRCPDAVNRKIKAEDALPRWKGRLLLFQSFFTPAGAGWAEAVSRPTRYSGSTLSCGFFFDSMVICPS
nr:MAG TPA: hypothetical protein [Caudoviricetes sp.]